ncbi:MAG: lipoyl synthase [Abitibacteriaceae bacterium]|nr:lipoyl synthase [Abditibacteriaceae bacterium]
MVNTQFIPLESIAPSTPSSLATSRRAYAAQPDPRLPEWLKVKTGKARQTVHTGEQLKELGIVTVCEEARCPNIGECWSHATATFMIGGDKCTRNCGFCSVTTHRPLALDPTEPERVATAAQRLGLSYVVITSVDRDDIADGGAAHWIATIHAVRAQLPQAKIEILTPDFKGVTGDIEAVAATRPDVYNHNIETVPRLYRTVRPGSKYQRSLDLLKHVKAFDSSIKTKSGLMTGLGETKEEIVEVLHDLKAHNVDFVTIGQYLRPSPRHLPVQRYYHPDEFAELKSIGERLGFAMVASGPFVRSSYHAGEDFHRAQQ